MRSASKSSQWTLRIDIAKGSATHGEVVEGERKQTFDEREFEISEGGPKRTRMNLEQ